MVQQVLQHWYNERAQSVINELFFQSKLSFTNKLVSHSSLQIKPMSNRWGSCSPKGKITLNVNLLKAPKACIEYVIIHELCHLIYFNHGKKFQKLLREKIPDWERWKDRLEMVMV